MSQFSEMMGSFIRTGNYPMEANYIFPTEAALKEFYNDPINATTLHKGLLKVVENEEDGEQALYWVVKNKTNDDLEFVKLLDNLDDTYIRKTKDSTDVQIADGSTLPIDKFVGDLTYDSTTGELFVGYPTTTGESIKTQVIALPEATEDTAGLLSAKDKSKLNTLNWETID